MLVAIIGCGYVGCALAKALVRAGYDVVGTTTRPERCAEIAATGATTQVLELAQVRKVTKAIHDCDTVVVMVAPTTSASTHEEVYLNGVRHLLEAVASEPVGQILYASSTSVYGQHDGSWVTESAPTCPQSKNAQALVRAERELLEAADPLEYDATVLRLAGIIGPGRGPANRIASVAGTRREDADGFINLIHCDDIVNACLQLIDEPYSGVLNLSDGRPVQRRAYYDRLIQAAGLPAIRWASPAGEPDLGKRVDNRRASSRLGLSFRDAAQASIDDLVRRRPQG